MESDIQTLMENIESCYDLRNKSVIQVAAGGGQLVGYGAAARSVLAVDADPEGVRRLGVLLREKGLLSRFIVFRGEFLTVRARADVVFFEFALHRMADPDAALRHAKTLAPETLVVDAALGSRWAWYLGEETGVERTWEAVGRQRIARDDAFMGAEQCRDYSDLLGRVRPRGEPTLGRIEEFRDRQGIAIPMPYRVVVLR